MSNKKPPQKVPLSIISDRADVLSRLAILIDADNASATIIDGLFAEVAKYGVASVKRIYGDWTQPRLSSWKKLLLDYSITPVQQFSYTAGKNATDSALIIDAMDLLYTQQAPAPVDDPTSLSALISSAVDDVSDENGWANLGAVGSTITKLRPNFDPRLHGHTKLSDLVRALPRQFVVEERGQEGSSAKSIYVRNTSDRAP